MDKTLLQPLTLDEMFGVYEELRPYLPIVTEEDDLDVLEYINTLLDNITLAENPDAFVHALGVMAKITIMDMTKLSPMERMRLFAECIIVNRLWLFGIYLDRSGYYYDTSSRKR